MLATAAQAAFEGREITRAPDMCNTEIVDTVSWYAEESVRLSVEPWRCGKRVEIPPGATAACVVADEGGTNWIVRYDAAPASNRCSFALSAGEGNLPATHDYTGYVSLLRGTNILGVLDRHEVRVMGQAADGGSPLSPEGGAWGSLLQRMAEAEADIAGIAGDLAHQAEELADLEGTVTNLDLAVEALDGRVDAVEDGKLPAVRDIDTEGNRYNVSVETEFRGGININETGGGMGSWPRIEGAIANNAAAIATNAAGVSTNAAAIAAHLADTNNPHGVTAEQVGALPVSGGTVDGDIVLYTNAPTTTPSIIFDRGGEGTVDWKIQNQAGTLRFQNRPGDAAAWRTPGVMVSTGGVVAATGFSGGGDDLTVGTNTLGSWVAASEAAVASVERRVEALEECHEWPDTCTLFWPSGYVQSNTVSGTLNLPTDFPTHRLLLVLNDEDIESLTINLPYWNPGRCVEIELHPIRLNNTTRSTKIAVNGLTVWDAVPFPAYNTWRYVVMQFDPASGVWQCDAPSTFRRAFYFDGTSKMDLPTNSPATVEEWKARLAAPQNPDELDEADEAEEEIEEEMR